MDLRAPGSVEMERETVTGTRTVRGLCSVERTTVLCSQEGSGTPRMIAVSGDAPLRDPVLRPGGHVCHTLSARTPPMGLHYVGLRAWIETSLHCLSSPQQLPFMGSQALTTAAGGDAILRRHAGMVRSGDSVGLRRLSMSFFRLDAKTIMIVQEDWSVKERELRESAKISMSVLTQDSNKMLMPIVVHMLTVLIVLGHTIAHVIQVIVCIS